MVRTFTNCQPETLPSKNINYKNSHLGIKSCSCDLADRSGGMVWWCAVLYDSVGLQVTVTICHCHSWVILTDSFRYCKQAPARLLTNFTPRNQDNCFESLSNKNFQKGSSISHHVTLAVSFWQKPDICQFPMLPEK